MSKRRGREREREKERETAGEGEIKQEVMDDDAWKGKIRRRGKTGPESYSGKKKQTKEHPDNEGLGREGEGERERESNSDSPLEHQFSG